MKKIKNNIYIIIIIKKGIYYMKIMKKILLLFIYLSIIPSNLNSDQPRNYVKTKLEKLMGCVQNYEYNLLVLFNGIV